MKGDWYHVLGVEWGKNSDPDLNKFEGLLLKNTLKLSDSNFNIKPDKEAEEYALLTLINKNLVRLKKDEKEFELTTAGKLLCDDLLSRNKLLPARSDIERFIQDHTINNKLTRKYLSEQSGLSMYRVGVLGGWIPSCKPPNIDDLYTLLKALQIEYVLQFEKSDEYNKEKEKMKFSSYQIMGIDWKKKDDIVLNNWETYLFINLLNIESPHENYNDIIERSLDSKYLYKAIESLIDKGILQKDDSKYLSCDVTEKGIEIGIDMLTRKHDLPKLESVRGFLRHSIRSQPELSLKTGLTPWEITKILKRSTVRDEIYLEDIKKLLEGLGLDYEQTMREIKQLEDRDIELRKMMAVKNKKKTVIKRTVTKKDDTEFLETESPIESKLLKEILKIRDKYNVSIRTQKRFTINSNKYRADMYIEFHNNNRIHGIVIECDGHEFHEKTKEQAVRDKKRDRDFLSIGIITIRFAGTEIWKNPEKCAVEIFNTYDGYVKSIS